MTQDRIIDHVAIAIVFQGTGSQQNAVQCLAAMDATLEQIPSRGRSFESVFFRSLFDAPASTGESHRQIKEYQASSALISGKATPKGTSFLCSE